MRRFAIPLSILALSFVILGVLSVSSCLTIPEDVGLHEGKLRPCPSSPNCVSSETSGESSSIAAFNFGDRFPGQGAEALASLVAYMQSQPRVEIVTQDSNYVHAVFITPLMRYRDDLELRLDEAKELIHVRSASRMGHSDLGANRKRVEALRAGWSEEKP